MDQSTGADENGHRRASCLCGGFVVTIRAEPVRVQACTCLQCQKESGSAFSYTAFFPEDAVTIEGEHRRWGDRMGTGHGGEILFCPTCSGRIVVRLEAVPGVLGIGVGTFGDPDFPKPEKIFWWRRHHRWLMPPTDIETIDTQ